MNHGHTDGSTVEFVAGVLLLIVALFGGCAFNEFSCASKAEAMGLKSSYGPVQGCLIKVNGRFIPIESYRTVAE